MKQTFRNIVFFLGVLALSLYLIPSFNFTLGNKEISFQNLPSLNGLSRNLNTTVPFSSNYYLYRFESTTEAFDSKFWNEHIYADQKNLEKRAELFLGTNYDVRFEKVENKAVFTVKTIQNIDAYANVLVANNPTFLLKLADNTSFTLDASAQDESALAVTTSTLTRADFGPAEILQSSSEGVYQVRMSLGLIGPEKLKEINSLYTQILQGVGSLSLNLGDQTYTATFTTNTETTAVTHLVINTSQSFVDALEAQTYLNSDPFTLSYTNTQKQFMAQPKGIYKLGLIIGVYFIILFVVSALILKNLNLSKVRSVLVLNIVFLAGLKFLNIEISSGLLLFSVILNTFAILGAKTNLWIYTLSMLLGIKLLGYLYFLDFRWTQVLYVLVFMYAFYRISQIKIIDPKYNN